MNIAVNVVEVGLLVLAMLAVGGLATWSLNRRRRDVWHELAIARGLTFSERTAGPRVRGRLNGRLVEVSLDDFSSDRDLGGVEVVRIAVALRGVSPAITAEGIPGLIGDLAALGEERIHFSAEPFQQNVLVRGDEAQARDYWSPPRQDAFLHLVQTLPCDQVEFSGGAPDRGTSRSRERSRAARTDPGQPDAGGRNSRQFIWTRRSMTMLGSARCVVLWNPSAGSAERAREVREELQRIPHLTIEEPQGREASIQASVRAAERGVELIIAAGGDGTVNSVITGIVKSGRDPVLGVLPVGTGNDLSRALGMPLEPFEAVQALSAATLGRLDVAHATSAQGTHLFANMVTAGNTGRYLQEMTGDIKSRWGPLCYLRGVVDVLRDLQVYRAQIACDGRPSETFEVLNIFIANGRYSGGGLAVSPEAAFDDGQLDLVIVKDGDAIDIASLTTEYVVADYLQHDLVEFRRAAQIEINARPQMPASADGEEIGETPLSVRVEPQRLRVLLPPATTE